MVRDEGFGIVGYIVVVISVCVIFFLFSILFNFFDVCICLDFPWFSILFSVSAIFPQVEEWPAEIASQNSPVLLRVDFLPVQFKVWSIQLWMVSVWIKFLVVSSWSQVSSSSEVVESSSSFREESGFWSEDWSNSGLCWTRWRRIVTTVLQESFLCGFIYLVRFFKIYP